MPGAKHTFSVNIADDASAVAGGLVLPSHWNAEHTLSDIAAQTSLDAVSNAVSVVSQAVSVLSQATSVADAALSVRIDTQSQSISVLSQAISVISQQVSILSQTISVYSQRWSTLGGGAISTYLRKTGAGDFAWEWGSVTAGGVGSVTSAQRDVLSSQISVLSVQAALVDGHETEMIWEKIFGGTNTSIIILAGGRAIEISSTGGTASVTSAEADVISNAVSIVSTAASNALSVANAASNAASIVSTAASNALSVANAASNAASVVSNAVSVVSQAVSVLSQATSVAQAALSVRIDTQSQAISVISQQVSALSQAHSALSQAVSVLSNAASNALSVANAASNAASIISQRISAASARSVGNISTHGLQSVFDALSNRISVAAGGSASPTSQEHSVLSQAHSVLSNKVSALSAVSARNTAALSVQGLQSIVNALSNRISAAGGGAGSVTSTELSAVSAQAASAISVLSGQISRVSASAFTISVSVMTDISGLSVVVSAGGHYEVKGFILFQNDVLGGMHFGLTFPAMTLAGGFWRGRGSQTGAGTVPVQGSWNENGSGSTMISISVGVSATNLPANFDGFFVVSTGGVIQVQGRVSIASNLVIQQGSYIRAYKIN